MNEVKKEKSRKNVCFLCFTFSVFTHFVPLFSHSGFCLNVLNQNLEILKSVNFQYAHCVRSCVSAVIVISLFSLTFTYFFVHLRHYFRTRIYYQTKWWLNRIFAFVSFKKRPIEMAFFGSSFHVIGLCTFLRLLSIQTTNFNPPVCNRIFCSSFLLFYMKFNEKKNRLFNQIICNLFAFCLKE